MRTLLERTGYDPAQDADNGNRFLVGNGYMGVRGTLGEFGPEQLAAVNLAGITHRKGSGWREPLNAPNPMYVKVRGAALPDSPFESHRVSLDIADGVFRRETVFTAQMGTLRVAQERFCCMEQPHLLAQRVSLTAERDRIVELEAGVDQRVWDIHGPHYECFLHEVSNPRVCRARTDAGQEVCVAWRTTLPEECAAPLEDGLSLWTLPLRAGETLVFDVIAAVYTTNDLTDPGAAALSAVTGADGYGGLLAAQRRVWADLWADARVEIEGDERAEFALNYSLYHLISVAPRHGPSLSVPARGLSGQTYKGAVFWDTEIFMLDFYLSAMPEVARTLLRYRIDTLPGALAKAAEYGLDGAFYAWESQEGGVDGCSDYNVTDVFTGRPMRTYFRDKQVHISAAVVYGLCKYLARTGDDSLLRGGGARVLLECARFYLSLLSRRMGRTEYDLNDVVGPDEYHERVNNNAYTNEMARMTIMRAHELCPRYLPGLDAEELDAFADAARKLKRQHPDPATGVIAQFDGYFALEDADVDEVRGRLLDPREYWGGAYGVAAHTQVIKQADVIAMLMLLNGQPRWVEEANYTYYSPRTEHGSSLSACMYALCACKTGRTEEAYSLFLRSAEADIMGGGKQWAGLVYIGGTHPAAAGGAYMVLLYGFLGLRFESGRPVAKPALPKGWKRVRVPLWHGGERCVVEVRADSDGTFVTGISRDEQLG